MKNLKIISHNIYLIYPNESIDLSDHALTLCEGFITRLLSAKKEQIKITINTTSKLVECNEPEIKKYMDLILKSRKINSFYEELEKLLFDKKTLRIIYNEQNYEINIDELRTRPDFIYNAPHNLDQQKSKI